MAPLSTRHTTKRAGIPFWWTLIDMSFGVFGVVPLYVVRRRIRRLEALGAPLVPPAAAATG